MQDEQVSLHLAESMHCTAAAWHKECVGIPCCKAQVGSQCMRLAGHCTSAKWSHHADLGWSGLAGWTLAADADCPLMRCTGSTARRLQQNRHSPVLSCMKHQKVRKGKGEVVGRGGGWGGGWEVPLQHQTCATFQQWRRCIKHDKAKHRTVRSTGNAAFALP